MESTRRAEIRWHVLGCGVALYGVTIGQGFAVASWAALLVLLQDTGS